MALRRALAPPTTHERHVRIVDGHAIAVRRWQGPAADTAPRPVVLVHGLVVSNRYQVPLGDRLSTSRAVHAPDLPGYGDSDSPSHDLDTRELGGALVRWLEEDGLCEVDLVANSYGCQVAAEATLMRPERVARLVLLAPTIDRRGRQLDEQVRRWKLESRTQSGALRRIIARDYAAAGLRRARATLQHALADAIEDKLPYLDLPALVVRGTRDPIVPQRWAEEVAHLLPQGQLAVLPGATHAIGHEQPRQTARVIEHFLAA